MNTRLDDRARRAAAAVHQAVAESRLHLMEAGIPALRRPRQWPSGTGRAVLAGAVTALVVFAGLLTARDALFAPDTATPPPTTFGLPSPPDEPTGAPTTTATPPTSVTSTTATTAPSTTTTTLDLLPPMLAVTAPADGSVLTEKVVRFEGITEPGATVKAGPYEADVDAEGNWSLVLVLSPGDNLARFTAVDAAGNEAEATVTVRYEPPAPETTTTTTKPAEDPAPFVANYTWGTCPLVPPYDEYYGTGEPGTKVVVTSAYGEGSTMVGEDGTWYVKVFFPEAPLDEPFSVILEDTLGRKAVFEFTYVSG